MVRKLSLVGLAVLLLAVAFLAGYIVSASSRPTQGEESEPVVVSVENGSVGRSMKFNAELRTDSRLAATNTLAGVVTSISTANQFDAGDTIYAVNEVPVFTAQGEVPFYRDLREGMQGKDVAQLNGMLNHLGYPVTVDEAFGPVTKANVKQWQKDTGQSATGEIPAGQLIAVPSLPSALVIDTELLQISGLLSGGEQLVFVPDGSPSVFMVLGESQAKLLSAGNPVVLSQDGEEWSGIIGETTPNEQMNTFEVEIVGENGQAICTDTCPIQGSTTSLVADVELVPTVTGPIVPRAAIMTEATGDSYVVMSTGDKRSVVVQGVSDGVAVVDGVEPGESVRVFGDQS